VTRYLTTASGFWFDCITSVPWSYMDLVVYRVRSTLALLCRILGIEATAQTFQDIL
jgi:hypothetical protein